MARAMSGARTECLHLPNHPYPLTLPHGTLATAQAHHRPPVQRWDLSDPAEPIRLFEVFLDGTSDDGTCSGRYMLWTDVPDDDLTALEGYRAGRGRRSHDRENSIGRCCVR